MKINLSIYGISIGISAADGKFFNVLKDLEDDFSYFKIDKQADDPCISIDLKDFELFQGIGKGRFFFKNAAASVYGWGRNRVIDYGGDARILSSKGSVEKQLIFSIFCSKMEDARELAYLTVLSTVGERLDTKGLHRVHALGIAKAGFAGIVTLPSGYGKTSMAALLSHDDQVGLYSDETPLISRSEIHAYPVRMAIRPEVAQALGLPKSERIFKRRLYPAKVLYSIPPEKVPKKMKVSFAIVSGHSSAVAPCIRRCSKLRVFISLFGSMVVGSGIAQIAEHMMRVDSIMSLLRIALSRFFTAFRVTFQCDCFLFDLSKDAKKNAVILSKFLDTQGRPTSL